ncbi:hypothetical protein ABMA27_002532 [Loxostege sticticalis]|uniref:Tyrosine specific protein phosphatases domain-containing protein n=1 Tax=Loxostege sticticalis TaxID=481309 RepID=A0ABR3HU71_LOXSC
MFGIRKLSSELKQITSKLFIKFQLRLCFSSNKQYWKPKRKKMAPSIPDRWIPYKACGKVIEGTRFICFKVPLKKTVQTHNKEIKEIWDIQTLLSTIPNLGAVIDLTNTARYYDPRELQAAGVLHKKILMPGRIIPPEEKVIEFMDAVDEFLGKDCDYLVGIHCTHGLNRTGYMVCRYMRDRLGVEGKDAIKRFEAARGYQIERENYIADILGKKPPPPHLGNSTQVKPVENGDEDMSSESLRENKSDDSRRNDKRKYSYNGESWRDECRRKQDDDGDSRSCGRFVRHPSYFRQNDRDTRWSDRQGSSSSYGERSKDRYNTRTHKNSSDSDRSYDYRYDY